MAATDHANTVANSCCSLCIPIFSSLWKGFEAQAYCFACWQIGPHKQYCDVCAACCMFPCIAIYGNVWRSSVMRCLPATNDVTKCVIVTCISPHIAFCGTPNQILKQDVYPVFMQKKFKMVVCIVFGWIPYMSLYKWRSTFISLW